MENKRQTLSRPLASHLRGQSMGASSGGASPVLLARINEKKQELANLKELQALSGGLADQMEMLEKKLSTLSDGTEAVAAVLSNWHNVLRAINMASMKIPKPKQAEEEGAEENKEEVPLPQTLVRIPTQHAAPLLQQASSGNPTE
ncbi:dash complex subunit dad2 [Diplodia corticola]|uniref:DASH complex subunit DAD2 n=1 Tax=Diplodia corticola TaxID=236234 RepID=A0A1J9RBY1_9PEZI|nr:dash complex subunit dad2 [Diplodia corticola]OJD29971.1 dash complex subunit dad2 [Diplodia corticola]